MQHDRWNRWPPIDEYETITDNRSSTDNKITIEQPEDVHRIDLEGVLDRLEKFIDKERGR